MILLQPMWEVQANREVAQEKLAREDGKGLHIQLFGPPKLDRLIRKLDKGG